MPSGTDGQALPRMWRPHEALVVTERLLRECDGIVVVWLHPDGTPEHPSFVVSDVATMQTVEHERGRALERVAVVATDSALRESGELVLSIFLRDEAGRVDASTEDGAE